MAITPEEAERIMLQRQQEREERASSKEWFVNRKEYDKPIFRKTEKAFKIVDSVDIIDNDVINSIDNNTIVKPVDNNVVVKPTLVKRHRRTTDEYTEQNRLADKAIDEFYREKINKLGDMISKMLDEKADNYLKQI